MRAYHLLALLLAAPAFAAPSVTVPSAYYVAPTGSDSNPGTVARPFATLERARHAIREGKKAGALPRGGVTVWVRGGLYPLARTLQLTAEDSGTAEAPITYRAYGKEKPVLIGGKQITGFVPYKGKILKADVGAQGFQGIAFRQFLCDGKRQHLARYPNFDPENPYGGGYAYTDGTPVPMYTDIPGENKHTFTYKEKDARVWSRPDEVEVFVFARYNWWNNIVPIKGVDRATRQVTLAKDASYPIRPGDRYYFRNALEELDAPGEWYLDRQSSTLYFWPPAGTNPTRMVTYAPTLRTLIQLGDGTAYITFRGFTFECCEGTAIELNSTNRCLIAGNTIRNVGDYHGSGVTVRGGTHNGVVGNDLYEIGRDGINISGGDSITLTPGHNYAENNYLHHVGIYYKWGCGIYLTGCGNRASRNLIHDCPRAAITFQGNLLAVEYNRIRHTCLESEDACAIGTGGRNWIDSRGSVVRYNHISDTLGYGKDHTGRWLSPHFAWAIYLDDNTGGVDVIGNIAERAVRGALHLHNGRDNLVENNIFVDNALQQIECSGWTSTSSNWKRHLPTMIQGYNSVKDQPAWKSMRNMHLRPEDAVLPNGMIMSGNVFRRNILLYHDPDSALMRLRNVSLDHNQWDYNLYWHGGLPVSIAGAPEAGEWQAWQKQGQDAHSLVTDPLFRNVKKGDYRLKKGSPALALGFQPIPVEKIGPYRDGLRASWPIVEVEGAREKPLVSEPPRAATPPTPRIATPFVAKRAITPIALDGTLSPGEWPEAGLILKETPDRTPISGAPCRAVVAYDAEALYVALAVPLKDAGHLRRGSIWGTDDGAEVCLSVQSAKPSPTLVIHGFLSGKHESVTDAGATAAQAARLGAATRYRAQVGTSEWTAEWAIPWSALDAHPVPGMRLAFNVGVRRNETDEWINWAGTVGATWQVARAGFVVLE